MVIWQSFEVIDRAYGGVAWELRSVPWNRVAEGALQCSCPGAASGVCNSASAAGVWGLAWICRSDKRTVNDGPANEIATSTAPTTALSISSPKGICSRVLPIRSSGVHLAPHKDDR